MRSAARWRTRVGSWRLFSLGLGVRLLGLALLWLGDGSPLWWRKAIVVVGVALSIGGITVLRYMLLADPLSRLSRHLRLAFGSTRG